MIILSINKIKKDFGGKEVLKEVNLTLQDHQRMGLVGVNGSGKSTLLKIIASLESADSGTLVKGKNITVGFLEQHGTFEEEDTIYNVAKRSLETVITLEKRLRELEQLMATSTEEELTILGEKYHDLTTAFEKMDGYAWKSNLTGTLLGLGFTKEQFTKPVNVLSGGEQTRLRLATLLLEKPSLLLLDEPTNHLDLDAIRWLEGYLSKYEGGVIVVSHDRYFLDKICTDITELLHGNSETYTNSSYSQYILQRAVRMESRLKAYDLQQDEIERQKEIIARYRRFNREKSIKAAESREKQLNKMELLEKPEEEKQIHFSFYAKKRSGENVLKVKNLSKSFDNKTLFKDINLDVKRGQRIALLGPNGVGKTTLFKCVLKEILPDTGVVTLGTNVSIGYYDQKQEHLHPEKTVLQEVWDDFYQLEQTQIRNTLGAFLFTGDDVFQPINTLSGGEKGRVLLAKLMLKQDNLLLLDEPTNHLDMDSREILESALEEYEGTILAISHDRYFINRFATHIGYMSDNELSLFQGNYDEYLTHLEFQRNPQIAPIEQPTKTSIVKEKKQLKLLQLEKRNLKVQMKEVEEAIIANEKEVRKLEVLLADVDLYKDPNQAQKVSISYEKHKMEIVSLYEKWEKITEKLENDLS